MQTLYDLVTPPTDMSSPIALKIMPSQEESVMRHRSLSRKDSQIATSPQQEEDPWLSTPHDTQPSDLILKHPTFVPTNTYWVSPHGLLSKSISILDLTKDIGIPYSGLNDTYKEAVKTTLKDHAHTPAFTATRKTWLGLHYSITDSQHEQIAEWKHPLLSTGTAVLTFPAGSKHCEHRIELRNKNWGLRIERFVINSVTYEWEADSYWHSTNKTLYKMMGGKRRIVGKYAQKWWGSFVTGGILVVDEGPEGLDGVVAGLSLVVVLKKKRQRGAERSPGGGGS